MGKYSTKYSSEWAKSYPWVAKCETDVSSAKCSICNCTFRIDNGGLSHCTRHSKSSKHINAQRIKSGQSSQVTLNAMYAKAIGNRLNKFT